MDVVEVVNVFDLCNVLLGNQHALHGIDQVKSYSTKKVVAHLQVKTVIYKVAFFIHQLVFFNIESVVGMTRQCIWSVFVFNIKQMWGKVRYEFSLLKCYIAWCSDKEPRRFSNALVQAGIIYCIHILCPAMHPLFFKRCIMTCNILPVLLAW